MTVSNANDNTLHPFQLRVSKISDMVFSPFSHSFNLSSKDLRQHKIPLHQTPPPYAKSHGDIRKGLLNV